MFDPVPYVLIDGQRVPCSVGLAGQTALVLDDVAVDWGRDDYISHAKPATAQLTLYDRTGQWAARARDKRTIGTKIELWWELGEVTFRWFAGRITEANAKPGNVDKVSGNRGWLIELTAADKTADLGNILIPKPTLWPRESMIVRANKIKALANQVAEISEFYFYPGSVNLMCSPIDVGGRSLQSVNDEFYMSMGDTYGFHPDTNVVRHLFRRAHGFAVYLAQGPDGLIYVQASNISYDGITYYGTSIPGCETSAAEATMGLAANGAVTRVEASWKDYPNGGGDWTTVAQQAGSETSSGRRTVTFPTWLDDGVNVDPVVLQVHARGQWEGAIPRHPPIRWSLKEKGGWLTAEYARVFTRCGETQALTYISGSIYSMWLGEQFPVVAIIGGRVQYTDGGWIVTPKFQHAFKTDTYTMVTWATLDKGLTWQSGPWRSLSTSVSWHDLRFLTMPTIYFAS